MSAVREDGGDLIRPGRSKAGLEPPGGRRRFRCPKCNYLTYTRSGLQYHIRRHTGEKPFECQVCKSRFKCKSHLNRHLLTHTGVKPYACSLCPDRFARKTLLMAHMTEHYRLRQCSWTQVQQAHESVACLNPNPALRHSIGSSGHSSMVSPGSATTVPYPTDNRSTNACEQWNSVLPVGGSTRGYPHVGRGVLISQQWNSTSGNGSRIHTGLSAAEQSEPEFVSIQHSDGFSSVADSSHTDATPASINLVENYHLDFPSIDTSSGPENLPSLDNSTDRRTEPMDTVFINEDGNLTSEKSPSLQESVTEVSVEDQQPGWPTSKDVNSQDSSIKANLDLVKLEPSDDGETLPHAEPLWNSIKHAAESDERKGKDDAEEDRGANEAMLEVSSSGLISRLSTPVTQTDASNNSCTAFRTTSQQDASTKVHISGRKSQQARAKPVNEVKTSEKQSCSVVTFPVQPPTTRLLERDVYHCHYCEIFFVDCTMHILHMGLHGRENPWQCAICHRQCRDKYEFTAHSHSV